MTNDWINIYMSRYCVQMRAFGLNQNTLANCTDSNNWSEIGRICLAV